MTLGESCPYCKEPVRGRTCPNCGNAPAQADLTTCIDCGDRVAKQICTVVKYEDGLAAAVTKKYKCKHCD